MRALRPGDTGCLRRGTYRENVTIRRGGEAGRRIVLRPWPGERARLVGRLVLTRRADHWTVRGLWLDGRNARNLPSPTVAGTSARFVGNDVTNRNTTICFAIGHEDYGIAQWTAIYGNRIHHCGELPATNHHHGIYVSNARHTRIVRNWIYANADRGIQLSPDAQSTFVKGNVIEGNGQGVSFGGEEAVASSDNLVERNVISNSQLRHNVESFYPPGAPVGRDNLVWRNCVGGGARPDGGGVQEPQEGFVAVENLLTAPEFRNPSRGDYRLVPGSPCSGLAPETVTLAPGPARRFADSRGPG